MFVNYGGSNMKITHYIGRRRIAPLATVPSHLTPVRSSVWMLRAMLPVIIALFSWTWIQHRLWAGNYMTWLAGCGLGFCLAWFYEPVAAILLPAQCPKELSIGWDGLSVRYLQPISYAELRGFYWAPIGTSFFLIFLGFIIMGAEAAFQNSTVGFGVTLWGMSFQMFLSVRGTFAAGADILRCHRQGVGQLEGSEHGYVYWQGRLCVVKPPEPPQKEAGAQS